MDNVPITTIFCYRCQQGKPPSDYYSRKNGQPMTPCKCCRRELQSGHWHKNRESNLKKQKAYRLSHLQKFAKWSREYMARGGKARRQKYRDYHRERDKANPADARARTALRRARLRGARIGDQQAVKAFYDVVLYSDRIIPCFYCRRNTRRGRREVDHIQAISKGGAHAVENLCCSCKDCNQRKFVKSAVDFTGQYLLL